MKKSRVWIGSIVCALLLNGCASQNPVENQVEELQNTQKFETREWINYYYTVNEMPWEKSVELTLSEFPDVVFTWNPFTVTSKKDGNESVLFEGMPIWNVYLCDLTGDGLPEFCATVSFGSGIVDQHIIVYDFQNKNSYTLWERGVYDYMLTLKEDQLQVTKMGKNVSETGKLVFMTEDGTGEQYLGIEFEDHSKQ